MRRFAALPALLALAPLAAQGTCQTFALPGGLRASLREDSQRLVFRARLRLALKPGDLPPGKEGLLDLALRLLDGARAGHLGAETFDETLEADGIRLTRTVSAEALTWELACRSRDQDRALGLLADRVLRSILDPASLESARLACRRELESLLADPEVRLRIALGQEASPLPSANGLARLTFADVEAFRRRVFQPGRALLSLEGDLDLEQAKALLRLTFGPWTGEPESPTTEAAPPPVAASAPARIAIPGAPARAEAALPVPPGLPPALRALALLRLSNDPALAPAWLPPGPDGALRFREAAPAGQPAAPAMASLQARLALARSRPLTAEDLTQAKAAWAGARQVRALHPEAVLAQDQLGLLGALPEADAIAAVRPSDLQGALQRWLAEANQRWALVGDPKSLPTP